MVRKQDFHSWNRGSIPRGVTKCGIRLVVGQHKKCFNGFLWKKINSSLELKNIAIQAANGGSIPPFRSIYGVFV